MEEDTHFYIDSAPPDEVTRVLRVLAADVCLSPDEIADTLDSQYGEPMQRDHTYTPRRLFDLGLAEQMRDGGLKYCLTSRGLRVQTVQASDAAFARDLLHYLHFSGYGGSPTDRKYLWSYRRCCELMWANGKMIPAVELAALIQAEMVSAFPHIDSMGKAGGRFNHKAASCVSSWLGCLTPPAFDPRGRHVQPRIVDRYELAALALDDVYRSRRYRYGDAVVMDDSLLNQVAGVFFLDRGCCANLLRLAASITPSIKLSDTLAGPSVNLTRGFTIEDL
ncbi:MAG: hypothetical protein HYX78_01895 [Armatimonadetes bacterium]|nr:hypothetical protein [Armatimonadota bacterium]